MFKKKPILHKTKPNCKHCQYRLNCNKKYKTCHDYTGFTTPCFSCKNISRCLTYQYHVKKGWHVHTCPNWERDDIEDKIEQGYEYIKNRLGKPSIKIERE